MLGTLNVHAWTLERLHRRSVMGHLLKRLHGESEAWPSLAMEHSWTMHAVATSLQLIGFPLGRTQISVPGLSLASTVSMMPLVGWKMGASPRRWN
jgi:hypothetical protein